jgi:hypothetical protein
VHFDELEMSRIRNESSVAYWGSSNNNNKINNANHMNNKNNTNDNNHNNK